MREILAGEATPSQIAGFAVLLRAKGETVEEVEGLVATMYEFAAPLKYDGRAVDIVGTGGDRSHTVNISTMAALVTAGAGVPVVKHGNRAASSSCGSADVLEGLGIPLDLPAERVGEIAPRGRADVLLRAGLPLGAAALGRAAARARRGDDVQLPRPAGKPRPAGCAGRRSG